jgi:dephospho-CoA kinase
MSQAPGTPPRFAVGLTGGIGSGKSTVAALFAARGAAIVDTDLIARQLSAPGGGAVDALRHAFGPAFITSEGALDRDRMRALVFADSDARRRLEAILHPLILRETERAASCADGPYLIFDVPLLVESGRWKQRVARVLVVDCDEEIQLERVMQRSQLSSEQIKAIMAAQTSREKRLQAADDIIENNGDSATLIPRVERLHALYCTLAEELRR